MSNILHNIVAGKKIELQLAKSEVPQRLLESQVESLPLPLNLSGALMGQRIRLIAEAKKASPSKGLLRSDFNPAKLAMQYAKNGCAAVSILTNSHFQGSLADMVAVKETLAPLQIPVLRKDFLVDPYQILESRANGADAILLIVAILDRNQLQELIAFAKTLWIQCLVEVHNAQELSLALECGSDIIGINNRDLQTFQTDLSVTRELAPMIPKGRVIVSESGISSHDDLVELATYGVHAVLVGEALVTANDPGQKLKSLLGDPIDDFQGFEP